MRLSLAKGANALVISGTQIGAGLNGYAIGGSLIIAYFLGQIISCIVLTFQVLSDHYIFFRDNISKDAFFIGMRRYAKFPIFDSWSAFIGSISTTLPIFLLSAFFTSSVVGYYSLGMMVIQMPVLFIGGSISQVFFQRASVIKHEGERDFSNFVEKTILRLMEIGIFPTIIFLFLGPDLFIVIFGSQWAEAGLYTQIFAIWIFFMFITSPISGLFAIFEQQKLILIFSIVIISLRIIALSIGGIIGNVIFALVLFSLVSFISYGVSFVWIVSLSKVSTQNLIKQFIPYIFYCILCCSIVICLKWIFQVNHFYILILSTISGIFYYYIVIRKDEEFNISFIGLIDTIKNIIKLRK
jgi:O-antigen/teichoic acid export membrane protein